MISLMLHGNALIVSFWRDCVNRRGGNPAQGGGLDKKMIAELKKIPVKSRVRMDWTFEERPRVEKIEVLK